MFLIVGGDSEIGAAAYRAMKAQGATVAATTRRSEHVAADRPFLDLAAPLDSWAPPPGTQAVCLCAAIARLSACADDPEGSVHVNVVQTLALVQKLLERGIAVVFLSTNQVFDTMPLIGGWIKDLAAARPIRVFNDLALAPTPTDLVCTAIAALLQDRAR